MQLPETNTSKTLTLSIYRTPAQFLGCHCIPEEVALSESFFPPFWICWWRSWDIERQLSDKAMVKSNGKLPRDTPRRVWKHGTNNGIESDGFLKQNISMFTPPCLCSKRIANWVTHHTSLQVEAIFRNIDHIQDNDLQTLTHLSCETHVVNDIDVKLFFYFWISSRNMGSFNLWHVGLATWLSFNTFCLGFHVAAICFVLNRGSSLAKMYAYIPSCICDNICLSIVSSFGICIKLNKITIPVTLAEGPFFVFGKHTSPTSESKVRQTDPWF